MATALSGLAVTLQKVIDGMWRVLKDARILIALVAFLLVLLLLPVFIPQVPGQVFEDAASATQWLNTESDRWGGAGALLRVAGFFHIPTSPLLYVAGALLLVAALVNLADVLATALAWRQLQRLPFGHVPAAEPLPVLMGVRVYRRRNLVAVTASEAGLRLAAHLERIHDRVQQLPHAVQRVEDTDSIDAEEGVVQATRAVSSERCLLATRNTGMLWLRLLLPMGILMALAGLWFAIQWGWDVQVDAVTPGERYGFPAHAVSISWRVETATVADSAEGAGAGGGAGAGDRPLQSAALVIGVGEDVEELPTIAARWRVGGAQVSVRPGAAALVVGAQARALALPGIDTLQEEIGTVLSQPGSEEFILLPAQGAGLRLLRLPGEQPRFLAELYGADAEQPLSRATFTGFEPITLQTANDDLLLTITPITSLVVDVRETPGRWLVIAGMLLAIAGLVSMRRRPEFVLAQIAPWPFPALEPREVTDAQGVVILQSSSADALASALSAFDTAAEVPSSAA